MPDTVWTVAAVAWVVVLCTSPLLCEAQYGLERSGAMCFTYLHYIVCAGGIASGSTTASQDVSLWDTTSPDGHFVTLTRFRMPFPASGPTFAAVSQSTLYVCEGCSAGPSVVPSSTIYAASLDAAVADLSSAFHRLPSQGLPVLTNATLVALPTQRILLVFHGVTGVASENMYSLGLDASRLSSSDSWHINKLPIDPNYFGTGSLGANLNPAIAVADDTVFIVFDGTEESTNNNGEVYFGKLHLSLSADGSSSSGSGSDSGITATWSWTAVPGGAPISCTPQSTGFRQFQLLPYLSTFIIAQGVPSGAVWLLGALNVSSDLNTCDFISVGSGFNYEDLGAIAVTADGTIVLLSQDQTTIAPMAMSPLPVPKVSPSQRRVERQTLVTVTLPMPVTYPGSLLRLANDESCLDDALGTTPTDASSGTVQFIVALPARHVFMCLSYGTCAATGGAVNLNSPCYEQNTLTLCISLQQGCCFSAVDSTCFSAAESSSMTMRSWYFIGTFDVQTMTLTATRTDTARGTLSLNRTFTETLRATSTGQPSTMTKSKTHTENYTRSRQGSPTTTPGHTETSHNRTATETIEPRPNTPSRTLSGTITAVLSRSRTQRQLTPSRTRQASMTVLRTVSPTKTGSRTRANGRPVTPTFPVTNTSTPPFTWTVTVQPSTAPVPPPSTQVPPATPPPVPPPPPTTHTPPTSAPDTPTSEVPTTTTTPASPPGAHSSTLAIAVGTSVALLAVVLIVAGLLIRHRQLRVRQNRSALSTPSEPSVSGAGRDADDTSSMSPADALVFATTPEATSPFTVVRELYSSSLTLIVLATRRKPKYRLLTTGLKGPVTRTSPTRQSAPCPVGHGMELVVLKSITCVTPQDKQRALEEFALLQQVGLRTKGVTAPIDLFFNDANIVHGLPCVSWRGGRSSASTISAARTENIDVLHVVSSIAGPLMEGQKTANAAKPSSLLSFPAAARHPPPAADDEKPLLEASDNDNTESSGRRTPTEEVVAVDRITLVLEYYPDGDFAAYCKNIRRDGNFVAEQTLLHIIEQVASTLVVMHVHSRPPIVHCNVQPSNVLLKALPTQQQRVTATTSAATVSVERRSSISQPPTPTLAPRVKPINSSIISTTSTSVVLQGPIAVQSRGTTTPLRQSPNPQPSSSNLKCYSAHLGDFGSARRLGAGLGEGVLFDRVFSAPECFHASRLVSPAVDIWALGMTIVEATIGIPEGWFIGHDAAHQGEALVASRVATLSQKMHEAGYSRRLTDLVSSMLRAQPDLRVVATVVRDTCIALNREHERQNTATSSSRR